VIRERELLWRRKDIARIDAIIPSIDSGALAQHIDPYSLETDMSALVRATTSNPADAPFALNTQLREHWETQAKAAHCVENEKMRGPKLPLAFPLPTIAFREASQLPQHEWWKIVPSIPHGFNAFHLAAIHDHFEIMGMLLEGPGGQRISALNRQTPVYSVFADGSPLPPPTPSSLVRKLASRSPAARASTMQQLTQATGKVWQSLALSNRWSQCYI